MSLCVINQINANQQTRSEFSLKLLGIGRFDLTDEEILESLSKFIEPNFIEGLLFDTFYNFYILFLNDIDATCRLAGKKIITKSFCFNIYPLLECYVIDNVYPCVRNEDLCDVFRTFGTVFSVSNHHVVPNSSKFSHVLSGKRKITFLLPGDELQMYIPVNVVHPPYTFNVKKHCCACLTEGHSLLYCPDIEDDKNFKEMKHDESDSDGELVALIKNENIEFDKVEDSPPGTQFVDETSKQKNAPVIVSENPEKCEEIKQDQTIKDTPQDEKNTNSKIGKNGNLTEVVSTSKVCRFSPGMDIQIPTVKRPVVLLPPLAEELINKVCGTLIIEANVFKQLVLTDGRLKAEMVKFTYSYLEDLHPLLKLLKKVLKHCKTEKKYACLRGAFTSKVKRVYSILLDFESKR